MTEIDTAYIEHVVWSNQTFIRASSIVQAPSSGFGEEQLTTKISLFFGVESSNTITSIWHLVYEFRSGQRNDDHLKPLKLTQFRGETLDERYDDLKLLIGGWSEVSPWLEKKPIVATLEHSDGSFSVINPSSREFLGHLHRIYTLLLVSNWDSIMKRRLRGCIRELEAPWKTVEQIFTNSLTSPS